jgi:glycosyltransferase involved in cell wall biosynthesis
MTNKNLIIIPAYNEAASIGDVVDGCAAKAPSFDVLVIDDGSSDETAAIALAHGAAVVRHPFNLRYGGALQTGYRYAVQKGYTLAVQIDADGQHEPADVPKLAQPILDGHADVVVGSRFHAGSSYSMPLLRRIGSAWFGTLLRWLTNLPLSDPTSGLQALSRPVLELYTSEAFPIDYPDADMFVLLHRNGFRVVDIPATMYERPESKSMHSGLSVLYYVYKMTLAMLMNTIRPPVRSHRSPGGDA